MTVLFEALPRAPQECHPRLAERHVLLLLAQVEGISVPFPLPFFPPLSQLWSYPLSQEPRDTIFTIIFFIYRSRKADTSKDIKTER